MMGFGALDSFALDSLPAGGNVFAVSVSEIAAATDSLSGIASFAVSLSESATATDSVDAIFAPVSQPPPYVRDYWDCDGWGRIIPGSCIRR